MNREMRKQLTGKYFGSTAKYYDNSRDGMFVRCMYREILDRTASMDFKRVLDLGCGNGNVIALLQDRKEAEYYGLDLSAEMIEEAEKRLGRQVSLCVGDAENLPYEDGFFDVIICNASFHHYPNHQKAVQEMKRVLKRNGTIILGDPAVKPRLLSWIVNWYLRHCSSGDVKIWSRKEITALFRKNGFQVENWRYINHRTFMMDAVLK